MWFDTHLMLENGKTVRLNEQHTPFKVLTPFYSAFFFLNPVLILFSFFVLKREG